MTISKSESIANLAQALATAQGLILHAIKDSDNPFFKSKYADLASVQVACKKPLADNGLAVAQLVSAAGPLVTVTTMLMHKSGEWISSDLTVTSVKADPQGIGSSITYARRYGLAAMVGVAADDDDGNAASGKAAAVQERIAVQRSKVEVIDVKPGKVAPVTPPAGTPPAQVAAKLAESLAATSHGEPSDSEKMIAQEDERQDVLAAALLADIAEGFKALAHWTNWGKKHKAEKDSLSPSRQEAISAAYHAARPVVPGEPPPPGGAQ